MSEIYIIYTTIIHAARIKLGITVNEYCVADSIHKLSHNPKNATNWCYASKKTLADALGLTERTTFAIISKLIEKKIIEQNPDTHHLKTTDLWYDTVEIYKEEEASWGMKKLHAPRRNFIDHEESSYTMKKLHEESSYHHEETLPDHEESSYNKDKDNNKDINNKPPIIPQGGVGEVLEIFEFYKKKSGIQKSLLTDARKQKIKNRLKVFTLEEIKQAITNCYQDSFYNGDNERGWRANLDYIFRSDEKLENLLNLTPREKEDKIYADIKFDK